ncbi:predicted protein [Pyrenophora tritici-repentis Pt-1C-BFP]|uniref:Uncharacterized protein n=1 Tax=Pyrenophora tritici-repentis (strain Pt-1C-BFP) TaxID=426418 RepID=B2WK08_PYRTR|nr:uncharacterized protein PTRG_10197 [Pyrenophora tritici-repentis Pt-1C-BFP]EDU43248.1 predicted protein [Pyrenophora tritici-repentis Pt-1C-BFP]
MDKRADDRSSCEVSPGLGISFHQDQNVCQGRLSLEVVFANESTKAGDGEHLIDFHLTRLSCVWLRNVGTRKKPGYGSTLRNCNAPKELGNLGTPRQHGKHVTRFEQVTSAFIHQEKYQDRFWKYHVTLNGRIRVYAHCPKTARLLFLHSCCGCACGAPAFRKCSLMTWHRPSGKVKVRVDRSVFNLFDIARSERFYAIGYSRQWVRERPFCYSVYNVSKLETPVG